MLIPRRGLLVILRHRRAGLVNRPQAAHELTSAPRLHRRRLRDRPLQQRDRLLTVHRHTRAMGVAVSQVVHRVEIPQIRRARVPHRRLLHVLRHRNAVVIAQADARHRFDVTQRGGGEIPLHRLALVPRHAVAVYVRGRQRIHAVRLDDQHHADVGSRLCAARDFHHHDDGICSRHYGQSA